MGYTIDCSSELQPVKGATVRVFTGREAVQYSDYMALLYQVRRRRRVLSGRAEDEPIDAQSRRLLQERSFQWSHSVLSLPDGSAKIGLFHSYLLPLSPPDLQLVVMYGDQVLHRMDSIPRQKASTRSAQRIFGRAMLAIERTISCR